MDDNDTNRQILRAQLEGWGMEVVDHADPVQALQAARTGDDAFDVGVLDMHMPFLDGLGLARGLRDLPAWADVPLLLLTSLGERLPEAEEVRLTHLTKPVKAAALRGHGRPGALGAREARRDADGGARDGGAAAHPARRGQHREPEGRDR